MISCQIVSLYRIENPRMVVDKVLFFLLVLLTQEAADGVIVGVTLNDPILAPIRNLENWG